LCFLQSGTARNAGQRLARFSEKIRKVQPRVSIGRSAIRLRSKFINQPFWRLIMKFICLGYADHSKFAAMTEDEMAALMEECMVYDDFLRQAGHFAGGEALQDASQAVTLRYRQGKAEATDGPYAETKEQLGGILILEASNITQAVELMSKHPGVKVGPFEIRPADENINAMMEARQRG